MNDLGLARFVLGDYVTAAALFHKAIFEEDEELESFELAQADRLELFASLPGSFPLRSLNSVKSLAWTLQLLNSPAMAATAWNAAQSVASYAAFNEAGDVPGGDMRVILVEGGGLSVFDFDIPRRVCGHRSMARNSPHPYGAEAVGLAEDPYELYLDLVRRQLTHYTHANSAEGAFREALGDGPCSDPSDAGLCLGPWDLWYSPSGLSGGNVCETDPCPATGNNPAHLISLQLMVEDVLARNVPGDLLEAGVFRGGFIVFMRALLAARGEKERRVIAADSFEGIPPGSTLGVAMDFMVGRLQDKGPGEEVIIDEEGSMGAEWDDMYVAGREEVRWGSGVEREKRGGGREGQSPVKKLTITNPRSLPLALLVPGSSWATSVALGSSTTG